MRHTQGGLAFDIDFALSAPWTVVFGPSGSGKTTLLRALQGHLRPASGKLMLHGRLLADSARRLFTPPHRRPLRSAGQAAPLFPHLTVRQNIAWGIEPGAHTATLLLELAGLFQLEDVVRKPAGALSGGERRRVALARAVAAAASLRDAVLLLDEPFTGLDLAARDALLLGLRSWLSARTVPVLSVTHDVAEAFLLQAEILRLANGRITGQGPARIVLAPERERLLHQLGG